MRAIRYDHALDHYLTDVSTPEPPCSEVLLAIRATGVCGTDVHLHEGEFGPVYPLTPGHEVVGEVVEVGDGVTELTSGQLVAVDNMVPCGHCDNCQRAQPAFCRHLRAFGVTAPGGFAEYMVAPASRCHPVDDLSVDTAVLAEPLSCAIHGLDVLELQPGSDVLLLGAGPTGLILTQLLHSGGAGRLTVSASTPFKLDLAASYGADETVQTRLGPDPESASKLHALAPDGFDVVIDATGSVDAIGHGLDLLRDGGSMLLYGMASEKAKLPISPYDVFRRELTVKGSFARSYGFARAVRMLRTGRVRAEGFITHRFGLPEYDAAIRAVRDDRSCLKAVIQP
ncbi:alcohol dehydrogenase catalytic domain-containing protein [Streptomyces brasiliensis]|uniref:2-deoxy-scyllo-inosamine dehydrogenase n=1 Tax=Streptomyces brasiliensis TaxID=1954 RepID=A0A917LCN0_9ACTN|nr:alcohol dehydrogenase catalytic domain-containing protein [Streptomyces brasiliensis]GGJ58957.1 2-deoxy-scyllo-inosamine dehydrogenase [Streptomyces brasiliensis]